MNDIGYAHILKLLWGADILMQAVTGDRDGDRSYFEETSTRSIPRQHNSNRIAYIYIYSYLRDGQSHMKDTYNDNKQIL